MANKITEAVSKVVDILEDFSSEERARIVKAVFALFAEPSLNTAPVTFSSEPVAEVGVLLPSAAQRWMNTYNLTIEQLSQVFDIGVDGTVATIAADVPGKS
ncbi:MAG TPA: hypothetical protein VHD37_00715, partial [Candidatus Paceibacterota bacterium]|nr:hypothetical protein [Candidatus Paceibacterota bacterium]